MQYVVRNRTKARTDSGRQVLIRFFFWKKFASE